MSAFRRCGVVGVIAVLLECGSQDAAAGSPEPAVVRIVDASGSKRVMVDDQLFTAYRVDRRQPVLFPVFGPGGVAMTRFYPLGEGDLEERDHPHHESLWFAHGDVNGHDFWAGTDGSRIVHEAFLPAPAGVIATRNRWEAADGEVVCTDERRIEFGATPVERWIDYQVTIHASHGALQLGDTKEGTMGIRMTPSLRLRGPVAAGTAVNSEGVSGRGVWGKRARWIDYSGPVRGAMVGIAMFDHPDNPRHPTWWHAREYGLCAANPFGVHDFEGAEPGTGDLSVAAGDQVTFRYRFYFHRGDAVQGAVAAHYEAFAASSIPLYRAPEDPDALYAAFRFTDPAAWRAARDEGGTFLELFGASDYTPPFRSPGNIALLEGKSFGDFDLEVELQQTGREYGHRDMCLIFGYQDPSRFYYAHLASAADETAHNVFVVDGADRRNLGARTTSGVDWGEGVWHRVRLERRVEDGAIRVFFDDMSEPIMVAEDRRFGEGMIGLGSFDDVGRIRGLVVRGAGK